MDARELQVCLSQLISEYLLNPSSEEEDEEGEEQE